MIRKIIEHKIRNGALAFLAGLVIAGAALYMDVFRGDTSGTIGMYQIVGSLTGYMISGIGVVLIMKETEVRRTIQNMLFYGGAIIIAISVFADYLSVVGPSGFDRFQTLGLVVGLVIVASGFLILPQRFLNSQNNQM
jgi:peptidoglycan/LPS O-acetylase OafA/YrhL